jgi:hypothetical protein
VVSFISKESASPLTLGVDLDEQEIPDPMEGDISVLVEEFSRAFRAIARRGDRAFDS